MMRASTRLAIWALGGAIVAIMLSLASLSLPPWLGGYNAWGDAHLALHNVAAILTRLVVFAAIGAALAGIWHHKRRVGR